MVNQKYVSVSFKGDCMDFMQSHTDKFWDVAIPDPVYGIDGNSHRQNKNRGRIAHSRDYHMALWGQPQTDSRYFDELFRVSKHQFIFGGNYFEALGTPFKTPRRGEAEEWISKNPKGWILWDKCNGTTDFNDFELIWTSMDIETRIFRFMWSGFMQGKSIHEGHIMRGDKSKNVVRIHPTEKPPQIYQWLYLNFTKSGDKVLDTHMGSQASRIAAYDVGIDFYGCEIVDVYFDDGNRRYNNHINQLRVPFN